MAWTALSHQAGRSLCHPRRRRLASHHGHHALLLSLGKGEGAMRLTYDPRYNIAYIRFQEKRTDVETVRISDELVVDMAPDGTIYGIETPDSIGFRGWWKTCVSNRMIPPLALYCVWSKQRRIGSQRHGTIPRKEYLCAVRE